MNTSHDVEVVPSAGVCCSNALTLDQFCGNGTRVRDTWTKCHHVNDEGVVCGERVRGEVFRSFDIPPRMYMVGHCPDHGRTSSRLSSDAGFYYTKNDGVACACGPTGCGTSSLGENAATDSSLHTCTLVVEIVYDCNLACPTCYADSPHGGSGKTLEYLSFALLKEHLEGVIARQGVIDIIQLSGGEPTLHPELFEILLWLGSHTGIKHVLLNTNGTKLADPLFAQSLARVVPEGRFGVYLQYEPETDDGSKMRGGDFRVIRRRARMECSKYSLPVALVMTVSHHNKFECSVLVDEACSDDNVKWIIYQPEALLGRFDARRMKEIPISVADVVHSVARGGLMDIKSWMPLPCSDPNCGTIGFLVRIDGDWRPVSSVVDMRNYTSLIANRMNFDTADTLGACGCDEFSLGDALGAIGVAPHDVRMVFIKPFMDARTYDESRIASCCTHVLTPTGNVDSFCRYYGSV